MGLIQFQLSVTETDIPSLEWMGWPPNMNYLLNFSVELADPSLWSSLQSAAFQTK